MQFPNWFEPYALPMFEKHLTSLAGKPGLRFLQVGAFTGDATVWLLTHALTGDGSTLTDIDTWAGSDEPEHAGLNWADIERHYKARTIGFQLSDRLTVVKATSRYYFGKPRRPFDFIYIDGDHTTAGVFEDGLAAIRCLKPGGLLAFDDYQWKPHGGLDDGPGAAVDKLLAEHPDLTTLELDAQAWFRA